MKPAGKRLLVVAPNWLGDSVMAGPAVAALGSSRLAGRVSVLARPSLIDLWKGFPGVDDVIPLERGRGPIGRLSAMYRMARALRARNFDGVLILPPSFSSALLVRLAGIPERAGADTEGRGFLLTHPVESVAPRSRHAVVEYLDLARQAFGVPLPSGPVRLSAAPSRDAGPRFRSLLADSGIPSRNGFIALGPGATYGPAKRWPLEHWRVLIDGLLSERRETLLLVGGSEEARYLEPLVRGTSRGSDRIRSLAGKTPTGVLAQLLCASRIFITNDTGPMHLAAAVGTPVVALFGSTSPSWTRPWGRGHRVLCHPVPCSPCFQRRCNIGYPCLRELTPDRVLREAMDLLRRKSRVGAEELSG